MSIANNLSINDFDITLNKPMIVEQPTEESFCDKSKQKPAIHAQKEIEKLQAMIL